MTEAELIHAMFQTTLFRWRKYCFDHYAEPDDFGHEVADDEEWYRLHGLLDSVIDNLDSIITLEQIEAYIIMSKPTLDTGGDVNEEENNS